MKGIQYYNPRTEIIVNYTSSYFDPDYTVKVNWFSKKKTYYFYSEKLNALPNCYYEVDGKIYRKANVFSFQIKKHEIKDMQLCLDFPSDTSAYRYFTNICKNCSLL